MFEKAAEKYFGKKTELVEVEKLKIYTDGAEFGYKKGFEECAKARLNVTTISDCPIKDEWHFVEDGDLPKAYQKCYFIYSNHYNEDGKVDFSESSIKVLTGLYAFYLDEETGEETTDPCFYDDINDDEISPLEVYAWKEIVLPELKESK